MVTTLHTRLRPSSSPTLSISGTQYLPDLKTRETQATRPSPNTNLGSNPEPEPWDVDKHIGTVTRGARGIHVSLSNVGLRGPMVPEASGYPFTKTETNDSADPRTANLTTSLDERRGSVGNQFTSRRRGHRGWLRHTNQFT